MKQSRVGVTKPIFSILLISQFFKIFKTLPVWYHYLYDIIFIFERYHHSWALETPDKYESDLKYLTYTLVKSKLPVMEKLINKALVTPTPGSEPISALTHQGWIPPVCETV